VAAGSRATPIAAAPVTRYGDTVLILHSNATKWHSDVNDVYFVAEGYTHPPFVPDLRLCHSSFLHQGVHGMGRIPGRQCDSVHVIM
jgi:hypothetical protein